MAALIQKQIDLFLRIANDPLRSLNQGWEWVLEVTNDETVFVRLCVGIMVTILTIMVLRYALAKKTLTDTVKKVKPWFAITKEELAKYDGSTPFLPILLSVRGVIYDVTPGKDFYGPGGGYNVFAGKECARALAKVSTDPKEVTGDISDLTSDQKATLLDWENKFKMKYEVVGTLVDSMNLTLEELKAYNGIAPDRPMLLAVMGRIYDVSKAQQFYGPHGMYPGFAGHECARALAKMSFEEKDLTDDVSDLTISERDVLENWIGKFEVKYRVVGKVVKAGAKGVAKKK